ncbi:ABC transporter permease [Penaeicola halotolerans]|uniref:ABC transporter permease n=1 Tax=Penaeicola halotolerans TaxID=2793196 RepID=UPI001CF8DEDA|nr:FtsX-like permease family protein [Penaeicola halotolerans]
MNFTYFIANRYFLSKKKRNFISILTLISMVGVAVGTMALIIVLSVFNGIETSIKTMYSAFDAPIKISPAVGKSFLYTDSLKSKIKAIEGVSSVAEVIEDNALFKYNNAQVVATLKGVSEEFIQQERLKNGIFIGKYALQSGNKEYAIMGRGIFYRLGAELDNDFSVLQVFYPKATARAGSIDPSTLYEVSSIKPNAFFALEKEIDDNYVIVPIAFAESLMSYEGKRTALEVEVSTASKIKSVQSALKSALGAEFTVLNADEQHSSLLKAIQIEKLFVYITFSFILAVASFNIFFSLSMLGIEKKKDVAILKAMGATDQQIKQIFRKIGAIIAFSGAALGLSLGYFICYIQDTYGLVSLGIQSSLLDSYPVKMELLDFVFTSLSVIIITLVAAYRPAAIAAKVEPISQL